MAKVKGALDETRSAEILDAYSKDPKNVVVRHALSRNPLSSVIYDSSSLIGVSNEFSLELKTLPVANQKASGRCWIFAGLNILREIVRSEERRVGKECRSR